MIEVPSERRGRLALVGAEIKPGETVPARDKVTVEVGFLAFEVSGDDNRGPIRIRPEKWWKELDATGTRVFACYVEGGSLPNELFVAREKREYRKLHVGDSVEEGCSC